MYICESHLKKYTNIIDLFILSLPHTRVCKHVCIYKILTLCINFNKYYRISSNIVVKSKSNISIYKLFYTYTLCYFCFRFVSFILLMNAQVYVHASQRNDQHLKFAKYREPVND